MFEAYTNGLSLTALQRDVLQADKDKGLLKDNYAGPWISVISGYEFTSSRPLLWTTEARRLIQVSLTIREASSATSQTRPSEALNGANLPQTRTHKETMERLRQHEIDGTKPEDLFLQPLILETALYMLACYDFEHALGYYVQFYPAGAGGIAKKPMSRYLDLVKEQLSHSDNEEFGALLLAGQSPESAREEIKKWRRGDRLPSWNRVKSWPRDRLAELPEQVYWAIGYVRIIQKVFEEAIALEKDLDWFQAAWFSDDRDTIAHHVAGRYHSFS